MKLLELFIKKEGDRINDYYSNNEKFCEICSKIIIIFFFN